MKKLKPLEEFTPEEYLAYYSDYFRYCVRWATCDDYGMYFFRTLARAKEERYYAHFETIWADRPLVATDYPLGEETVSLELMEWPKLVPGALAEILNALTDVKTRHRYLERYFMWNGQILTQKVAHLTKEWCDKKGYYLIGYYVATDKKEENVDHTRC